MAISKLNEDARSEREKHAETLRAEWQEVVDLWNEVDELLDRVNEQIGRYNAAAHEANEWKQGMVSAMEEYFDERSEKWQEGEKGREFDSWKSEWDGFEVEEVDPVEIEIPDEPAAADDLESLPEEPS